MTEINERKPQPLVFHLEPDCERPGSWIVVRGPTPALASAQAIAKLLEGK